MFYKSVGLVCESFVGSIRQAVACTTYVTFACLNSRVPDDSSPADMTLLLEIQSGLLQNPKASGVLYSPGLRNTLSFNEVWSTSQTVTGYEAWKHPLRIQLSEVFSFLPDRYRSAIVISVDSLSYRHMVGLCFDPSKGYLVYVLFSKDDNFLLKEFCCPNFDAAVKSVVAAVPKSIQSQSADQAVNLQLCGLVSSEDN